ncbi:MAG: hypothetical protein JRI25_04030 [Deltaproteobacteria bacterium]|nr:hypothetical protein [Deltaproteobacteria bacterium]MBW2253748.1 hypothetical protein [Deltaproteobacteria bacterium]
MHRLDRRIRILRGKRSGAFDPDQYYLEKAFRARAARKVRLMLRRQQPVILITPRWSEAREFLDDISVDLSLGRPRVECRTLSMAPMFGRSVHDSRTWVVRALGGFIGVSAEGPAAQAVDRQGFRNVVRDLLRRAGTGPRRALLVHHLQYLQVDARNDLIQVFEEYMEEMGRERRLNLLLAGTVDVPSFELEGAKRVTLPDFSSVEALEALTEYTGPASLDVLRRALDVIGGVPALVHRLGQSAEARGGRLAKNREELWKALGQLTDEVRGAIAIVSSDEVMATRFEQVANSGPLPYDKERDLPLVRAGVLQEIYGGLSHKVMVRAPVFAEMALSY